MLLEPMVLKTMGLLWLAGVAMRMTILAMPPVIPLVHDELHMSETQVGLLVGLPLLMFALAAVPGSLLISHIGSKFAVLLGMVIAALAGAARGLAHDVATLYLAAIATGFGVAIMQPGLPTLVREWLPERIALGTIAYTSGMLMGAMFATVLTIPFVLPLSRRQLAARSVAVGGAGDPDRAGVFSAQPKRRQAHRRQQRDRRTVVAGMEKSAGLAARPHARQQQQRVFFDQRLS